MKRRLYLYVTDDKYELPLVVADSVAELARKVGRNESSVSSMISPGYEYGQELLSRLAGARTNHPAEYYKDPGS